MSNFTCLQKSENEIHARLDALDFQGKTLELAGTALSKAKCVRFDVDLSIVYQLVFAFENY